MNQGFIRLALVVTFCIYFSFNGIFAATSLELEKSLDDLGDDSGPFCFQFTWLGPKYDNESVVNTTCKDLKAKPCMEPLVITHDGSPPNTTFMWENYDISQITCKLPKGEACTKWVEYYANEISNITYMCSKYTVGGVSKTNWEGCEVDYNSTYTTEVCACRSEKGKAPPCNGARHLAGVHVLGVVLGVAVALLVAR